MHACITVLETILHTYNVVIGVFERLDDLRIADLILDCSRENGREHHRAKQDHRKTKNNATNDAKCTIKPFPDGPDTI